MNFQTYTGVRVTDRINDDGFLAGVEIQQVTREDRIGSVGQVTKYGDDKYGPTVFIPADKLTDFASSFMSTVGQYADGRKAQHLAAQREHEARIAARNA